MTTTKRSHLSDILTRLTTEQWEAVNCRVILAKLGEEPLALAREFATIYMPTASERDIKCLTTEIARQAGRWGQG